MDADLKILEVATLCNCCRGTVLNYEKKGLISSARDLYGNRRYTQEQAERLRLLLSARWPSKQENETQP